MSSLRLIIAGLENLESKSEFELSRRIDGQVAEDEEGKRGLLWDNSALPYDYGRCPPQHSFAISLSNLACSAKLADSSLLLLLSQFLFLFFHQDTLGAARGSFQKDGGIHDRGSASSIFNSQHKRKAAREPRQEEQSLLASSRNLLSLKIQWLNQQPPKGFTTFNNHYIFIC